MIASLLGRAFARMRRPAAALLILPCLSIPNFAVDEFHVEGKALRSWIHQLRHENWGYRCKACNVIGEQGERARGAVPALIAALDDEEWLVRVSAVHALGEIATPPEVVLSALLPKLQDTEPAVRSMTEMTLSELVAKWKETIDPHDFTPLLLKLFTASYAPLRLFATACLCEMQPVPDVAVPALVNGLQDESPLVRGNCLIALSKRAAIGRANLPAIRKMMQSDPKESVRVQAALAVWRLEKDAESAVAVMAANAGVDEFTTALVRICLEEMGPAARAAAPSLRARLQQEDNPSIRSEIKRALTAIEKDGKAR